MIDNASEAATLVEPPAAFWRDPATYDLALQSGFIAPLEVALRQQGQVPRALQLALVQRLHWYFTVDGRERAPTVTLTPAEAPAFHDRMREIMHHIDADVLEAPQLQQVSVEVRHALLSYQNPVLHSTIALEAYDHDQGLVRLSYYVQGSPPHESFLIDGMAVTPAFAKYRACRYFHRTLLRQRIVWLPATHATTLDLSLGGKAMSLVVAAPHFSIHNPPAKPPGFAVAEPLARAREAYPPGKGGQQPLPFGWAGSKVRLLGALSHLPWIRKKFAHAWVFVDREEEADDNAEHLYRWVRHHHPEINAWFVLDRSSPDWVRLSEEGFRLVPMGLTRKLMTLNAAHIVSSQPQYSLGSFNRALYGNGMRWRFTYLRHGIQINDQSHWLNAQMFDRLIATSPEEFAAVVSDDTPYQFTAKEARLTGAPRHDLLLKKARLRATREANWIVVFPTWRGALVGGNKGDISFEKQITQLASSPFAQRWSGLLNNAALRSLVERHGKRLVFMPHPNAAPYLAAFRVPAHVEVLAKVDIRIQDLLCRTAVMITDYSSIAFEMALLRRPLCYYQFDRKAFFSGDHNWREGYFDFERDGFGPVVATEKGVVQEIETLLLKGVKPAPEYLERMKRAIPNPDGMACQRVFESILQLDRPYRD